MVAYSRFTWNIVRRRTGDLALIIGKRLSDPTFYPKRAWSSSPQPVRAPGLGGERPVRQDKCRPDRFHWAFADPLKPTHHCTVGMVRPLKDGAGGRIKCDGWKIARRRTVRPSPARPGDVARETKCGERCFTWNITYRSRTVMCLRTKVAQRSTADWQGGRAKSFIPQTPKRKTSNATVDVSRGTSQSSEL